MSIKKWFITSDFHFISITTSKCIVIQPSERLILAPDLPTCMIWYTKRLSLPGKETYYTLLILSSRSWSWKSRNIWDLSKFTIKSNMTESKHIVVCRQPFTKTIACTTFLAVDFSFDDGCRSRHISDGVLPFLVDIKIQESKQQGVLFVCFFAQLRSSRCPCLRLLQEFRQYFQLMPWKSLWIWESIAAREDVHQPSNSEHQLCRARMDDWSSWRLCMISHNSYVTSLDRIGWHTTRK